MEITRALILRTLALVKFEVQSRASLQAFIGLRRTFGFLKGK
jgi:hypothetical protein